MLALAIVLSSSITALVVFPPSGSGGAPVTVLVHAPAAEVLALAPDATVVEAYDSFVLLKAPSDVVSSFQAHGIIVDPYEESHWINLESVRFDVRVGEPVVPAELRAPRTDGPARSPSCAPRP